MKAMLTPHKPGDSGILCLPLKSNVPNGHKNWKLLGKQTCPGSHGNRAKHYRRLYQLRAAGEKEEYL